MTDLNLLDVPQSAAYLAVSKRMIRRLIFEKRIRYTKVGKHVRLRRADLDRFIEANTIPADGVTPLRKAAR